MTETELHTRTLVMHLVSSATAQLSGAFAILQLANVAESDSGNISSAYVACTRSLEEATALINILSQF